MSTTPDHRPSPRPATRHHVVVGGLDRTYLTVGEKELADRGAAGKTPLDIIFFFHGSLQSGSVARRFTRYTFDSLAHHAGALIVYPEGIRTIFNDARRDLPEKTREMGVDDVAFTRAILDELRKDYRVGRVFAAGFSNGGHMILRLLIDAPGLFTTAATIASALPAEGNRTFDSSSLRGYRPTPLLTIHGTADPIVNYDGGPSGHPKWRVTAGTLESAYSTAEFFARHNGVSGAPEKSPKTSHPFPDTTVYRWAGAGESAAAPVELWSVAGMGHLVPGGESPNSELGRPTQSFSAADVIGRFFGLI